MAQQLSELLLVNRLHFAADNDQLCRTNLSTTVLTAKSSGPGAVFSTRDLHASLAGSLSVGAGRAQGRGFDVEEYAERIYRANNLRLAEVPRDYFDSAGTRLLALTEGTCLSRRRAASPCP